MLHDIHINLVLLSPDCPLDLSPSNVARYVLLLTNKEIEAQYTCSIRQLRFPNTLILARQPGKLCYKVKKKHTPCLFQCTSQHILIRS